MDLNEMEVEVQGGGGERVAREGVSDMTVRVWQSLRSCESSHGPVEGLDDHFPFPCFPALLVFLLRFIFLLHATLLPPFS